MDLKSATPSPASARTSNSIPSNFQQSPLIRQLARHHQRRTNAGLTTILMAVRRLKCDVDPDTARLRDHLDRIETALGDVIDAVYSLSELTPEDLLQMEAISHRPTT